MSQCVTYYSDVTCLAAEETSQRPCARGMELDGAGAHTALHAFSKTETSPVSLYQGLSLKGSRQSLVLVVGRCAGVSRGKEMQQCLCLEGLNW